MSGLVETRYGLHIIKVDKSSPVQTLQLDKVHGAIENWFMDQKMKVEYRVYLSQLKKNAFIENKLSPPLQSAANNPKGPAPEKTLKPSFELGDMFADVPSPQKKNDSSRQLTRGQEFPRFQNFEEELRYYKQLRNDNKINEVEYQNKKRKLLNRF